MREATRKAAVLIEALPYIQNFRGSTVVVKFGGSAMEDPETVSRVLADVAFMECVGMRTVVVHGGGKAISRGMVERGIESRFLEGLRVTCKHSIEVVRDVLNRKVNPGLVAGLIERRARAESLIGEKIFHVHRKQGTHPETGEALDWGFVGEPGEVNIGPIEALIAQNVIPVITPLGIGPDGKPHNINADVAAAAVAKALRARKLVFLSDVPGLMRDPTDEASVIATQHISEVRDLIADGTISGGMLPKIESSIAALEAGVRKVHMIDGRMAHSLLLEIFTDNGVGTEIIDDE